MKKESNKNWTTCLRLYTGDGSPRVFLLNSHFLGSVPYQLYSCFFLNKIKYVFPKETHSIKKYKNDKPSLYFTTFKTPKLKPTKTKNIYKLLKIFFLFKLITTSFRGSIHIFIYVNTHRN